MKLLSDGTAEAWNEVILRWGKLTDEQLQGASYALRILATSTAVVGKSLEVLRELITEVRYEIDERNEAGVSIPPAISE